MRRSASWTLPLLCALLLLPSARGAPRTESPLNGNEAGAGGGDSLSSSMLLRRVGATQLKEYNFYYDETRWVPGWLQCDASREVMIFGDWSKTVRYASFPKRQPAQKTVLNLYSKGEPDCGMMKCNYTLVASGKTFELQESHYLDEEAYWTNQYSIRISNGKGRNLPEQECRWLERTRLAIITDRRSIYVTESETGELQYQSYNYQGESGKPSVMLKDGRRTFDERKGTETFTFQSREYRYVLNVSALESKPSVEVLVKKNGSTVQQERCLSYTYLKKS